MTGGPAHYFNDNPEVPSSPRLVDLVLPDLTTDLASDSGVFAAHAVDPGTRFLLLSAPAIAPATTNVADVGCGYGPIARTMAHRAPQAQVWAVDVNKRALALAAQNLAGLKATAVAPHEVPADLVLDVIWSNPPIRIGKPALHRLLTRWLDQLKPETGYAILVVQKHLGADSLARWLTNQGWATTRLGSRQGYRLIRSEAR